GHRCVLSWRVMNRTLRALLVLVVTPALGMAQETGRVEGVATISSRLIHPRQRTRVYDEPGSAPAAPIADANPFGNVVLYLQSSTPLRGRAQPGSPTPAMRQHGEQFVPHVLPIL